MEANGLNIVAIDTSGPTASCAVMRDGEIIHSVFLNQGLTHSETIMPALDEAMMNAQIDCSQVDAFVAVAGPGSFTGVRIGVCAVKGLAHAHNTPCASVDALEALAMNVIGFDGIACPILDARRGQVYCAAFDVRGELPVRVLPDQAIELNAYLAQLPRDRRLIFVGDGLRVHADAISNALDDRAVIAAANLRNLRADAACVLAMAHRDQWMEARRLVPIYLRAPQAERERDRRLREGE